jgi:hypothetical protein
LQCLKEILQDKIMMHSAPDRRLPTITTAQRGLSGNAAGAVQAYLALTGITDIAIIGALNDFVTGLINDGLWDKIDVMYPFIGGNATAHSINLKNPGLYTITTFTGSVVHNNNGVTGTDSANASFTVPFSHASQNPNDFSFGTLGRFPASTGSTSASFSLFLAGLTNIAIDIRSSALGSFVRLFGGTIIANTTAGYSASGAARFIGISSNSSSTAYSFINQYTQVSTIPKGLTASGTTISVSLSSASFPAAVFTYSFWYTGKQLTETEMNNLNKRVQVLNQTLDTIQGSTRSNNYYINPSYNKVTNAFISSIGVANLTSTEQNAIDYLVTALQGGTNLWSILGSIHPFVGSTIGAQSRELKTVTSTFSQSASTVSAVNATPLGVDPTAINSTLIPVNTFIMAGTFGTYITEESQSPNNDILWTLGRLNFQARTMSNTAYLQINSGVIQPANTTAKGHYTITNTTNATSASPFILYKNATALASGATSITGGSGSMYLFSYSGGGSSSLRSQGIFYSSNTVLNQAQITELNSIVQQYISILGRT